MDYERLIRRIRNGTLLDDDATYKKASRVLGKALDMRRKRVYEKEEPRRGKWSNLTASELARSGTVETDWY